MGRLANNILALGLFAGQSTIHKDKLLDLAKEMDDNIAKLRNIANGCSTHKTYRGQEIFDNRQFLGE